LIGSISNQLKKEVLMDIFNPVLDLLSSGWLMVILAAGAMFAAGVFIDEKLLQDQEIGTMVIISSLFGLVVMAVFAGISSYTGSSLLISQSDLVRSLLIGVGEIAWVIPYLYALKRRGAVVAGPMFQLIPVVGGIAEAILFGIIPPSVHIVGALLIVGGGFVLSIEEEELEDGTISYVSDWKTVGYMALSATIAALIYVFFKDTAGGNSGYVAVGFWTGLGMVLTGIAIWLFWKPYRTDFNSFCRNADGKMVGLQLFNESMDAGGAYLTHLANIIGPSVLVVTAFNAVQPVFILIFAAALLFFGIKVWETEYKWKIIAPSILTIAVGTYLIAL
jgi:EamA-like transporter family